MAKEKGTLKLNAENLAGRRALVGPLSLSADIDAAVAERDAPLRHLAGGAVIAEGDLERLAAHAANVTVASVQPG